jgi:hypothetical protein
VALGAAVVTTRAAARAPWELNRVRPVSALSPIELLRLTHRVNDWIRAWDPSCHLIAPTVIEGGRAVRWTLVVPPSADVVAAAASAELVPLPRSIDVTLEASLASQTAGGLLGLAEQLERLVALALG